MLTERGRQGSARGFTLVEMMIIVVIVGVLATLGTFGVMKYVRTSRTSEAMAMVTDIKMAEEIHRDETLSYLGATGTAYGSWHPNAPVGNNKADWNSPSLNEAGIAMRTLAVVSSGPVYFRYTVVAGASGAVPSPDGFLATPLGLPGNSNDPFYVVVARGDLDGDGTFSHIVGHSFGADIRVDREGE